MGRHAKSPDLKLCAGNPGKRALKPVPQTRLANPRTKAPSYLSAEAKEIWKEKLSQLVADRLLSVVDLDTLANYCEATATIREATRKIAEDGSIVEGPQGTYLSPWIKIRADASTRAWKAAAILGIGQLNRQRLQQLPDDEKASDPEERFFAKVVG